LADAHTLSFDRSTFAVRAFALRQTLLRNVDDTETILSDVVLVAQAVAINTLAVGTFRRITNLGGSGGERR
jgi:hypothetical protein